MSKLEKDISRDVKTTLSALELAGSVLWWERLQSLNARTDHGAYIRGCRPGTADYVALLPISNGIMPYFMELKSDSGKQSQLQIDFQKKVESFGCVYEVIRDVKQVKTTVETITGHYKNKLDKIDIAF